MRSILIHEKMQVIVMVLFLIFCFCFARTSGHGKLSGEISGTVMHTDPGRIEIRWQDAETKQVNHEMFDIAELDEPLASTAKSVKKGDAVTVEYITVRGLKTVRNIAVYGESLRKDL